MFAAAGSLSDHLAIDVNSVQGLRAKARTGDPEALRAAARQFEAMFVQILLKTMRATHFSAPGDPLSDGNGTRLYQELLDQQWAQKMADGRGFGFAEMLVKGLRSEAVGDGAAVTPSLPAAPVAPVVGERETAAIPPAAAAPQAVSAPALSPVEARKRAFVDTMRPHAEAVEAALGVSADLILAHAALESGWGARQILAADGTPSHNLFGIKAGRDWRGAVAETLTTEFRAGLPMQVTGRFRAYEGYAESFADYAALLSGRYRAAVGSGDDAGAFVAGLVSGGYATDPGYAGKLLAVIRSVAPTAA